MNYGVHIPVLSKGFLTAQDNIGLHKDVLKEKGCVYFSTSDKISPDKGEEIAYLLLSNKSGLRFLCEVVSYDYFPDKGLPSDSTEYSMKKFADVPEKHWFKLSTMKEISSNEVSQLMPINKQMAEKYLNVEEYIVNTGRLQVFYFKKEV